MAELFQGFSPEGFRFLKDLKRNNKREWFQPRKDEFERLIRNPMIALVSAINEKLAGFAPDYVTDPKKAIFRIYRDTRFSPDKTPYKTRIAAYFSRRGLEKQGGAGLYFSISDKESEVGGGIYHPPADVLASVRMHIAETHGEFRKLLSNKKLKAQMGDLQGEELTRPPKGFAADHPALGLLKKKDWFLMATLDPAVARSRELAKEIEGRTRVLAPVLEYLNRPLLARRSVKPDPLTDYF